MPVGMLAPRIDNYFGGTSRTIGACGSFSELCISPRLHPISLARKALHEGQVLTLGGKWNK